jgi:hypothetical protein
VNESTYKLSLGFVAPSLTSFGTVANNAEFQCPLDRILIQRVRCNDDYCSLKVCFDGGKISVRIVHFELVLKNRVRLVIFKKI